MIARAWKFIDDWYPLTFPLFLVSIGVFVFGLICGGAADASCGSPWHRIEYVAPWFRLGCWLGGIP